MASFLHPQKKMGPTCVETHREAQAGGKFLLLDHASPVPRFYSVPSYPSVPHPFMLPRHFSPLAGEALGAGWVTGEPPTSGSITADAGKLPTLKVRPF